MVSSSSFLTLPACLVAAASSSPHYASAFQIPSSSTAKRLTKTIGVDNAQRFDHPLHAERIDGEVTTETSSEVMSRRSAMATTVASSLAFATAASAVIPSTAHAAEEKVGSESLYAPKFVQTYEDFTSTSEGWSYKEVKVGNDIGGGDLKNGDRVVFDWSGYTIGYFGRPFEAKGGPQGGAFDKDLSYFRTILGSGTLVPGLECALRTMKPGGVRQVIVPYGPLSYPPEDKEHELVGPKPTTFSGMRALNFVLENERVDRTLLFNVKLIRVDRSDGKGGFIRG